MNKVKFEVFGVVIFAISIAVPFLLNHFFEPATWVETTRVAIVYLIAMFVYYVSWKSLDVLVNNVLPDPSGVLMLSDALGMFFLTPAIIVAFMNIKWWVVLLCLPVFWFVGNIVSAKLAYRLRIGVVYFVLGVCALSVMFHAYYK